MNTSYQLTGLQLSSVFLLPLEVFCADDSKISLLFSYWQMLVGHGVVTVYFVVVSNLHHYTIAKVKLHLILVGLIIQLVDVFSRLYYVVWVFALC